MRWCVRGAPMAEWRWLEMNAPRFSRMGRFIGLAGTART
jgi:hypothetical protein